MAHQQPGVFDLQCSLLDRRLRGLPQPLQDEIGVVLHFLEHILSGDNEVGRRSTTRSLAGCVSAGDPGADAQAGLIQSFTLAFPVVAASPSPAVP
jgi:hypothetical protein